MRETSRKKSSEDTRVDRELRDREVLSFFGRKRATAGFGSRRVYFNPTRETHATIKSSNIIGFEGRIDSSTPTSMDILDWGASPLGELAGEGVEYLSVQQCDKLDFIDLSSLDGCPTLQGIRIFRNNGKFKQVVLPSDCPALVEVTIEDNYSMDYHPIDLNVLDGSPELRFLRLHKNGGRFILPSECPSLEVLNLTGSTVKDWRLEGCPELKLVMLTSLGREKAYYKNPIDDTTHESWGGGKRMTLDLGPLLKHYMSSKTPPIIYISDEHDIRVQDNIADYDKHPKSVRDRIIQYSYGTTDYFIFLDVGEKTGEEARRDPVYNEYREISELYGEEVTSRYADLRPPPDKNL